MCKQLRFDNRVALITGAGGGLGRAHALLLAERGAKVVVNELANSIDAAEKVVDEISLMGGEAIAVAGRIGVDEDARHLVEKTIEHFKKIDIVVNNAGTVGGKTLVQDDPGPEFERELDVHLRGALQVNRAAWPHMVKHGYGRILFTGSAVALGWYKEPLGYEGSYACAKSALFGAARQTAAAGQEHDIKVNILMPWAYTPMVDGNLRGTEFGEWMKKNLRCEQVAAGIAPLLHEHSPCTGQAISVAGGRVTRILFASPPGYFNPDLTPENVLLNWDSVEGIKDTNGTIQNLVEITGQPGEYQILMDVLNQGSF